MTNDQISEESNEELLPASESPWYHLLTWYGEPAGIDPEGDEYLVARNRDFWHRLWWNQFGSQVKEKLQEIALEPLEVFSDFEITDINIELNKRFPPGNMFDVSKLLSDSTINFCDLRFPFVDFSEYYFLKQMIFDRTHFVGRAYFNRAHFASWVDFREVYFSYWTDFRDAYFANWVDFSKAHFAEYADFWETHFADRANFRDGHFAGLATFRGSYFTAWTDFGKAHFADRADFRSCHFADWVDFREVHFGAEVQFNQVNFEFSVGFQNTRFKSTTDFSETNFDKSPKFHGSELYVNTRWHDVTWPKQSSDKKQAVEDMENWGTLKFLMNQVMRHDAELDFHAKELEARKVVTGKAFISDYYREFSDYGRSIARPFIFLGFSFVLFFFLSWMIKTMPFAFSEPASPFVDALMFSAVNSLPFMPLFKHIYAETITRLELFIGAVQYSFSLLMWFLVGLAVRNRFRIK